MTRRRCRGLITILALFCGMAATPVGATPPYQVICYALTTNESSATNINAGAGPNINWTTDVPWNDMTVVVDAFLIPNNGNTFSNGGAKGAALITPAHAKNVRCAVAFAAGDLSNLCLPANRASFASAVTAMMMSYGYDGLEVDWEQTGVASQADATAMMQDLYNDIKGLPNSTVDSKPRTLSFTTNPSYSQVFNMTTLGSYTDWCFFMGYDWYDYPPNVNGPLNGMTPSIAGTIDGMTNGGEWSYPISKMIVGCPLYTNDYQAGTYYDTLSILHLGTAGGYDASYAEQSYTAPNGDNVYVDTAQSFCDKTNWALNNGLKGIGLWDMGQGLPYTDTAMAPIWNTIGGNAACLNLGPTNTPTKTPTPVVSSTWRVVSGGPAHTDCQSNVWAADENYSGGTAATSTNAITGALPCSTDQALYQDQRYGANFSYTFNVPAGSYQVTLKFAETYWTAAGQRVFNVSINGTTVLTNFDIFKTTGAQNKAIDEVFNNIAPTGGTITIQFGPASADNAEVDSIQIIPEPPTPTFTPTPTKTFTPVATSTATRTLTPSNTPTSTATKTFSPTASWTPSSTGTSTSVNTASFTVTRTSTPTSTNTPVPPTLTPTSTRTATPTNTLVPPTATATAVSTATASSTSTNVNTATTTGTATAVPPTATSTHTSVPPTSTYTVFNTSTATPVNTSTATTIPPTSIWTASSTNTAVPPTATNTPVNTPTSTKTPLPPTATSTNTAVPPTVTATSTSTSVPSTATFTHTSVPPTATSSNTPIPPTATPTRTFSATSVPPTATYTATHTSTFTQTMTSTPSFTPSPIFTFTQTPTSTFTHTPSATSTQTVTVFPNPAPGAQIRIKVPLTAMADVTVEVFTVGFRKIEQKTFLNVAVGTDLTLELQDSWGGRFANGLYYLVTSTQGHKWISKLLVVH